MRMIERGAKQRASLQTARELSGKLLHAPNCGQLRHILLQHFEVLEQQRALVFERRLKRLAAVRGIFDLSKDPGVRHRAPSDQNSIATGFAKSIKSLLNRH